MSIKIYHGPPGSYKTASAVENELIDAVKEGRVIVTNVRGITLERIHEHIENVPDTVDVIFKDLHDSKQRQEILTWWHWVPNGAFMLLDEGSVCFPKSLRPADIDKLSYKTIDDAAIDGRPHTWTEAWDMHRHYNWDIVITIPKISKLRDDIRGAAEMACKHTNQAIKGSFFKGQYLQAWHSADNNGSPSDIHQVLTKKMTDKSICFKLYDSTKTGVVKDTNAGFNMFKNPKLIFMGTLILLSFLFLFRDGTPEVLPEAPDSIAQGNTEPDKKPYIQVQDKLARQDDLEAPKPFNDEGVSSSGTDDINLQSAAPALIVKAVQSQPLLTGCVSTADTCFCYDNHKVKVNLTRYFCEYIQTNGFYSPPPVVIASTDDEMDSQESTWTNRVSRTLSPLSASSIGEVFQRRQDSNQRHQDNIDSLQQETRNNTVVSTSTFPR